MGVSLRGFLRSGARRSWARSCLPASKEKRAIQLYFDKNWATYLCRWSQQAKCRQGGWGGGYLIVQVVQQADCRQLEVEVRVRGGRPVGRGSEAPPLEDEGRRHADEDADEGGPRVDGCAVQVLDVAHHPAGYSAFGCLALDLSWHFTSLIALQGTWRLTIWLWIRGDRCILVLSTAIPLPIIVHFVPFE